MLLGSLFALVTSCASVKPIPQFEAATILVEMPLENSTAYWVPYYASDAPYEESIQKFLEKNPVCVSAKGYSTITKYIEYLTAQAKKRCK
jgi:hypothetical protein